MRRNIASGNHYIRYVKTEEYKRAFPFVYLSDGEISYSLLAFTKNEFDTGKGKDSALRRVFSVVAEIYEFYLANTTRHEAYNKRGYLLILEYFSARLHGTIRNNHCELGLFWLPRKYPYVKNNIYQFKLYQGFCKRYLNVEELVSQDELSHLTNEYTSFEKKTDFNLLSHLSSNYEGNSDTLPQRTTRLDYDNEEGAQPTPQSKRPMKYPPPSKIKKLIDLETNLNYQAAYLLTAFTGLRGSEFLHIMVSDLVVSSMGEFDVIVSHPNSGYTFDHVNKKQVKRTDVLADCSNKAYRRSGLNEFQRDYLDDLQPRTNYHNNHIYHAGWKGIERHITNETYGYLLQWTNGHAKAKFFKVASKLMKQKRVGHPYLFCNADNGMPMAIDAYESRFRRHTKKVTGVIYGGHSMRHFTGFYCANVLKLSKSDAQVMLRHKRPASTEVYFSRSEEEMKRRIAGQEMSLWDGLDMVFAEWSKS